MIADTVCKRIELVGIDGANPLGFLAALGTLVVLEESGHAGARLAWMRGATWVPTLQLPAAMAHLDFCEQVGDALRATPVSGDQEQHRSEAQQAFDAAKKIRDGKEQEIRGRRLPRALRQAVEETQLRPLEDDLRAKRLAWLEALKTAVARRELALGKHLDSTVSEYRACAQDMLAESNGGRRESLDLLAAFGSDGCTQTFRGRQDDEMRIEATPFCFISGSGHQYFLDTVRQLMEHVTPGGVRAALLEPWKYDDEKLSMRWDPAEDRRYALMDRDPTATDNRSRTVWMANLLAYRALVLFPSAPVASPSGASRLATVGWTRVEREATFSWPLWSSFADIRTVGSMLQLNELTSATPDRSVLAPRGIQAIFRARRIRVGNPPLFKVNFSPAFCV